MFKADGKLYPSALLCLIASLVNYFVLGVVIDVSNMTSSGISFIPCRIYSSTALKIIPVNVDFAYLPMLFCASSNFIAHRIVSQIILDRLCLYSNK